MKRILVSLSIIGIVTAIAVGATMAYFNDTETSTGNTMTAGTIDLKIDLQCEDGLCGFPLRDLPDEPAFFNECDIKPGDSGEATISWHIFDNKAWGKIRLANLFDWEYSCPDSEKDVDSTCDTPGQGQGELSQYLKFTFWMDEGSVAGWQCPDNEPCSSDPQEGDNKLNGIETAFVHNMPASQLVNGVDLPIELIPSTTYYLGMEWTIPADTGNIIQTDSLSGKIIMEVVQSRNNPRLINGGFETGNFIGWNVNGPAQVVASYTSDQGTIYNPTEGNNFAVLHAGLGADVYTVVSQTVALSAGQKLEGWAAYDAKDYLPFEDDAAVVIVSGGPLATPWSKDVSDVGNYGESPWAQWSWTAPADGTYTLELKVRNTLDNASSSSALFDTHVIQP